ncbi:MAG TPA: HlyD family secretion protein [Polyangiaceae bacterium]|jgi:membrane fusion protein (multidrug efflux system)
MQPSESTERELSLSRIYQEQLRIREELERLRAERSNGSEPAGEPRPEAEKKPDSSPPALEQKRPSAARAHSWLREHPRRAALAAAALVVVAAGALLLWLHLRTYESTDDAQIDGDISAVGARVSGTVTALSVQDNQAVKAGDVLLELDGAEYAVALAQAEANLAQAEAQAEAQQPNVAITETTSKTAIASSGSDLAGAAAELAALKQDQAAASARLKEADARSKLAEIDRSRSESLVESGSSSKEDLDQKTSAADVATAELTAARAAVDAASKRLEQQRSRIAEAQSRFEDARTNAPQQLDVQRATVASHTASVKAAQAALDEARLRFGYTRIVAPVGGIVGKKSVNIGDHVEPGQQLLAIVQTGTLWVTANFKETELARMHPGQRARIDVDAYGSTFTGRVESMPGASGARYSLFPPENASGNYVKVVQRLPVRIRLDPGQPGLERLRPGMSVEPKVYVR